MDLLRIAVFALLLCVGCAATHAQGALDKTISFDVIAKVARLQGGCNVDRCPQIQYQLVVEKLISRVSLNPVEAEEMSSVNACGSFGLIPGHSYNMRLIKNKGPKLPVLDRPITFSGDFAECEYYFRRSTPSINEKE